MNTQVQTLKGFRDFLGENARKRLWLIEKIRSVFDVFGFEPLETPALEYESLLTGKYGDEADKLIYGFEDRGGRRVALRYDQTIPTTRVIAQYRNDLVFPYRRYQIQPVWRADKPQQGRYREFTQCDVDIFGSTSPISDAEILACTYYSFKTIGYPAVKLFINDRQTLLSTLQQFASEAVSVFSIIQSVDKLDKIGDKGVIDELVNKGLNKSIATEALKNIQAATMTQNLKDIRECANSLGIPDEDLIFLQTLARGLDYYTGMIFEVTVPGYEVGSLCGGGRYDKLVEKLGGVNIPAVGIAFGFDRMLDAAEQFGLLTSDSNSVNVLVSIFDTTQISASLDVAMKLRKKGIKTEIYPGVEKLEKQLKFANKKNIPYVVIIGPEEEKKNVVQLKDMKTGEKKDISVNELVKLFLAEK